MKRFLTFLLVVLLQALTTTAQQQTKTIVFLKMKDNALTEYLIRPGVKSEATLSVANNRIVALLKKYAALNTVTRLTQLAALNRWIQVEVAASKAMHFVTSAQQESAIEYAEKAPEYTMFATPNDLQSVQWGLKKIHAEEAWDIGKGLGIIKVAIVDDAVKITHPDLAPIIWTNTGEIADNGKDDDNNGYTDDVHGWDCADNDNDPNPPDYATTSDFTHGTHCAGIAGAATDNGLGVASIGYGISIIPVKCKESGSHGPDLKYVFQGVAYAITAGADVISMSWGGGGYSQAYQELFNEAHQKGIVLVAAAGNSNTDIPMFPASYTYVISVGASDINDQKANFSNYGKTVDVMAPGSNIYSTLADATTLYGSLSGTSMACPMTAGLIGLMKSRNPNALPEEIEECLKSSCDDIDGLNPNYEKALGAGRINAYNALLCVKPSAPKTRFEANFIRSCAGSPIVFSDKSKGTPSTSWAWSFAGATPPTSTEKNPQVVYSANGVYDVTLIACNEYGCDTLTRKAYITIAPPKATIAPAIHDSVCEDAHTFLELTLEGNAPWTVKWSDGTSTFTENNILNSPHFISVTPKAGNVYSLVSVSDRFCSGTVSGTQKYTTINCSGFPPRSDNIWYFGKFAGLDFSTGRPIPLLNSAMDTFEGCATISDDNGNLLFYTDGVTVWNKEHKPMPNGKGLFGHSSSTQSAVITPDPGNPQQYYIFTVSTAGENQNGLYYSVVDMTLDSGKGNITSKKNVFMMKEASEKVTAAWHANKKDIWVVSLENGTNKFYVFLVSVTGISAPKITATGKVMTAPNVHGYLRFSNSGTLLANGFGYDRVFQLCRFNNTTGVPTLWLTFKDPKYFAYGVEFSPNDSKLYIANHVDHDIHQINLAAGSDAAILNSVIRIGTIPLHMPDALQLAPDGKIYFTMFNPSSYEHEYLGVIPNPNDYYAQCLPDYIRLGGRHCRNGLPNFLRGFRRTTQAVYASADTTICLTKSAQLSAQMKEPANCTYFWNPTDGLSDAFIATPVASPKATTRYIVTAIAPDGLRYSDSVIVYVDSNCCKSAPPAAKFEAVAAVCFGDTIFLTNTSSASSTARYLWQFGSNASPDIWNGAQPPPVFYSIAGLHKIQLIIEDSCGIDSAEQSVAVFPFPDSRGEYDTTICSNTNVVIGPEKIAEFSYKWTPETGLSDANDARPTVSLPPGAYRFVLQITDNTAGCTAYDTVNLRIANIVARGRYDTMFCTLTNISIGPKPIPGLTYTWTPETGLSDPAVSNPSVSLPSGRYRYILRISDNLTGCFAEDTVDFGLEEQPKAIASGDTVICPGIPAQLAASGGARYLWSPADGLDNPQSANPIATPAITTRYRVTAFGKYGCSDTASALVQVLPFTKAELRFEPLSKVMPGDTAIIALKFLLPDNIPAGNGITSFIVELAFDSTVIRPVREAYTTIGGLNGWTITDSALSQGSLLIRGTGLPLHQNGECYFRAMVFLPGVATTGTFALKVVSWNTTPDDQCTGITKASDGIITFEKMCASYLRPVKGTGVKYMLQAVSPNPADNDVVRVDFSIGLDAVTELSVYSALGERVAVPINKILVAGAYSAEFNAGLLGTGVYIIRLRSGQFTDETVFIKQ